MGIKRGFRYIYDYGIDEYFVLARMILITGILVLTIIILNGVDVIWEVFSPWSLVMEGCISSVFIVYNLVSMIVLLDLKKLLFP